MDEFKHISFGNSRVDAMFHEKRATFFVVPERVALNPIDPFNSEFLAVFSPLRVYETSENLIKDFRVLDGEEVEENKIVYVITKPQVVPFSRKMLVIMFSEINESIKVHNVRAYIELDNLIGDADDRLIKSISGELKSIYSLQNGGNESSLIHEQLQAFVKDYPILTTEGLPVSGEIILQAEISEYLDSNGYNQTEGDQ